MRIDLMRKIDAWFGVPLTYLCALFSSPRGSLWGEKIELRPQHRILVTKFMGLGSTVLASHFLSSLEKWGDRITIVTFRESEEFLRLAGVKGEILVLRKDGWLFFKDALKTIFKLQRHRYFLSIDLEPSANFTALFHFLVKARFRMGFLSGKSKREKLFTHLISYSSERHLSENYEQFARRLNFPVKPKKSRELKKKGKVLINMNASDLSEHRLWEENNWVVLGEKILKKYPELKLGFTGIGEEGKRVRRVASLLKQKGPVSDRVETLLDLDLKTLARKVQEAEMVISVDSFMLHFSEWTGTPVVGLFGPESPKLTGPKLEGSETCYEGLTCSPCLSVLSQKKTRCEDNQCMKQMSVDSVFKACVKLLEKDHAKAA